MPWPICNPGIAGSTTQGASLDQFFTEIDVNMHQKNTAAHNLALEIALVLNKPGFIVHPFCDYFVSCCLLYFKIVSIAQQICLLSITL